MNKRSYISLFAAFFSGLTGAFSTTFVDVEVTGEMNVQDTFSTQTGRIIVKPQDSLYEGGEIIFSSPAPYAAWSFDNYQGSMRLHHGGATYFQFYPNGSFYVGGLTGIKVSSPLAQLDVYGHNNNYTSLLLRSGDQSGDSDSKQIVFGYSNSGNYGHSIRTRHHGGQDARNAIDFYVWDYGTDALSSVGTKHVMTVDGNGQGMVGINTRFPQNELDVVGTIRAEEVIVESNWADFVFEPDYALPSIDEVWAHIQNERRLPGVPSAEAVREHGVSIGETQTLLLQKIEELTLYLIQEREARAALELRIQELESHYDQ